MTGLRKHARHYPMSKADYFKLHGVTSEHIIDYAADCRYEKAKFVFNCMKYHENTYDKPWLCEWEDADFGKLKNPEDAFKIWWDV